MGNLPIFGSFYNNNNYNAPSTAPGLHTKGSREGRRARPKGVEEPRMPNPKGLLTRAELAVALEAIEQLLRNVKLECAKPRDLVQVKQNARKPW